MKDTFVSAKKLHKAVAQSSKMEGLNLKQAKNNKKLIQTLKSYGRAFAILRQR